MKLYYVPGTSSLLPHITLVEADLPFDAIRIDEHTKALDGGGDYRAVNPLGYVPALGLDDGTVLTEAVAVAQFVADRVPDQRLAPPNGTLDRAKLQSWLNFICSELQVGCFCALLDRELPATVKPVFYRRLASRLAHVEHHLAGSAYLLGDDFSIADIYLFVVSNWARPAHVDLTAYPSLLALRARVGARPAVQDTMRREHLIS